MLATQAAVTLGLAPSLALFQQVSLVGPLANAGGHSTGDVAGSAADLAAAGSSTGRPAVLPRTSSCWLVQGLRWLLTCRAPLWMQHAPPWWAVALAIAGCVVMLAPRGWPHRWLALWCLPLFCGSASGS